MHIQLCSLWFLFLCGSVDPVTLQYLVSLRHLEDFTPARYQARERYQELAVFSEDTDIPLTTLYVFWQGMGGLKHWETEDLCMSLHRLSLLLTCDLGKGTIRLHDVMRNYLIQRAGSSLSALHARFLDVSKQVLGLSRWADLLAEEHYLWHYLVLHLCSASRIEELQATLTDLLYLTRKVLYVGISALEADLLLACKFEQADATTSALSLFGALHRTMVQISHLLWQVHTLAEVGGLLLSYLGWEPPFTTSGPVLPRPFLTAWHSLPDEFSSTLRRTLRGHTREVRSCVVSPDGCFIVSVSNDQTLKVWDTQTGQCLLTFPVDGALYGCAFHPDGEHLVACGEQGMYFLRFVV